MKILNYSFVDFSLTGCNGAMHRAFQPPYHPELPAVWRVCLTGFLALVVAMGVGRFAFTPLLPLMQAAGQLDLAQGAWLATANYLGYLAGAMSVSRLRLEPKTLIRTSVIGVALLTAAMSWSHHMALWLLLRFAAGVLSAWALVGVSAWCLAALAAAGRGALSGALYAGVGTGIALAGLFCLLGSSWGVAATDLWWQLGAGSALLCMPILLLMPRTPPQGNSSPPAEMAPAETPEAMASIRGARGLVFTYGCFGFGYILPATFLPALARATLPDPALFGWSWPVFGATAAASTVLAGTWFARMPRLRLWAICQFLMAAGTALPGLWPLPASVLMSAVLVGSTFMVVTMAGLQEAKARAGAQATRLLGQMTTAFALGQIAGPVASALLGSQFAGTLDGVRIALLISAAVLAASAWWLLRVATPPALTHSMKGASP
jgi:MFS family permease